MKIVNVVAAIIKKENRVFATQRGYGEFKGGWEFPGGKIEEGETPQEALIREIKEELNSDIEVHELCDVIEYDYEKFHLSMRCYWCELKSGDLTLLEASESRWLSKENLYDVNWLPADITIIKKIEESL